VSGTHLGRWVVGIVVLAIVVPLVLMIRANVWAYDHVSYCRGTGLVPGTTAGAVDPRAALQHLLVSGRVPELPQTGWTGPSVHGDFASGSSLVTVERIQGRQGWFATGYCVGSEIQD